MQQFYEQLFGDMTYKKKPSTLYPCEQFVVVIDSDTEDEEDIEQKYEDYYECEDYECDEVKVVDVGCEEHKVEIDEDIQKFVNNEMEKWMFEMYSEWYHQRYFGTLEHPICLVDDRGEMLRAINYYNVKNMNMVEMTVMMYGEQVDNAKQMLTTLGFQFEKIDMRLFGIDTTVGNVDNVGNLGSVDMPYMLYDEDGDMYYVYNCFTSKEDDKMYEMRIVFDNSQLGAVKENLKAAGFVV
jgi:hypothetical protein